MQKREDNLLSFVPWVPTLIPIKKNRLKVQRCIKEENEVAKNIEKDVPPLSVQFNNIYQASIERQECQG